MAARVWASGCGWGLVLAVPTMAWANAEQDYWGEVPTVLTASRLDQSLHDVPGAVTVISREDIVSSGARDITELLRWVPGYLVSGYNGANPSAAYHLPLDPYGVRNLVQIDGRSVYSPYYLGDTHRGLMTVSLLDIERIEVFRGSNSVSYGANAMLGVINIITRHAEDTLGAALQVVTGTDRIRDAYARVGWKTGDSFHRLSIGQRADEGWEEITGPLHDQRRLTHIEWRADMPAGDDEWMITLGQTRLASGEGFVTDPTNPVRTDQWDDVALGVRWRRYTEDGGRWQLLFNATREHFNVPLLTGHSTRMDVELERQFSLSPDWRVVWGGGVKREMAYSASLYDTQDGVGYRESRLFGQLEWQPNQDWVGNMGLFMGRHSQAGTYLAPRVALNRHFSENQTLRLGWTRSARMPTIFEQSANSWYNLQEDPLGLLKPELKQAIQPYCALQPTLCRLSLVAAPAVMGSETVQVGELSYLGYWREPAIGWDLRWFHEKIHGIIDVNNNKNYFYDIIYFSKSFYNYEAVTSSGVEYRVNWQPWSGTDWALVGQSAQVRWSADPLSQMPNRTVGLQWHQEWGSGWSSAFNWQYQSERSWKAPETTTVLPGTHHLDVRLAYAWRHGSNRWEWSLMGQGINGDQPEYANKFIVSPRWWMGVRVEF